MNKILRGGLRDNVTFRLLSENGGHVSTADVWEREYHNIIFIFMIILSNHKDNKIIKIIDGRYVGERISQ